MRGEQERDCISPWAPGVTWTIGENTKDGQYLNGVFPDGRSLKTVGGYGTRLTMEQWGVETIWMTWNWLGVLA